MNTSEPSKASPSTWRDVLRSASKHMDTGHYQHSMILFTQAVEMIESQHGMDDLQLCLPLVKLGKLHQLKGRRATAERFYRRSAEILTKNLVESEGNTNLKPYLDEYSP